MCCGILGQGVQKALSLDMNPYDGEKPHLIVVRFILRRGQTNVQIEIREFEGGVRATGLLCLLGVGIGLSTFLVYKLCSKLHLRYFTSSSVDKTTFQLPCASLNSQNHDCGISFGIKKLNNSGILHRSQVVKPQQFPQVWRKRIIDWLAKSAFPLEGEESESDAADDEFAEEDDDEFAEEDDKITCKSRKAKMDAMLASTRSGWSSGFVSNLDDVDRGPTSALGGERREEEEEEEIVASDLPPSGCGIDSTADSASGRKKPSAKHSRPNSGNSSISAFSGVPLHHNPALRRNCYSFASHKSGDSSLYDYRESLVSKGFSVDLGENLEGVIRSDDHEFVSCDLQSNGGHQDQGAVDHMDWLQYELTKIQLDIDCLNQRFDDLCQPKNDLVSEHQIPEGFLRKRSEHEETRSSSVESVEHVLRSHPGTPDDVETFDFIWDYHSDLASVNLPSFVSARPVTDRSFGDGRKFGSSRDAIDEESDEDDEDDRRGDLVDEEAGRTDGVARKDGRRESIVLFYFDDDINDDGFVGDLERSQSFANISTKKKNHFTCKEFLMSRTNQCKSSFSMDSHHPPPTETLKIPNEKGAVNRLLQPISPRNLKKSKVDLTDDRRSSENNNSNRRVDRIFSSEGMWIVGDARKLFEHLEADLHVDVVQISNIRKGYSKIFDMWGPGSVRCFRSERYSILSPVVFQVLLHGLPILSDVGGNFQNSVQYLVAAIDNGHQYLMDWKYRGFLRAPKNEVLFKLINSLRIFCEQVSAVRGMSKKKCREQYLVSLLNHSTDMEVHLVEALKIVIMLKIISSSKNSSDFFLCAKNEFGPLYSTAESVFRNLTNVVEEGTRLDDVQLSILSTTLSTRIEILRPSQWGSSGFVQVYPTATAGGGDPTSWTKMSIIEDEPAFLYCLPAVDCDD